MLPLFPTLCVGMSSVIICDTKCRETSNLLFVNVEVAYAKPDEQLILSVQAAKFCTVEQAIELSGILNHFPEIDLTKNKVGIFSQICTLSKCLQENDRVEIYRSLVCDPMEARRQRAIKQLS